jgi:cytochrome c oxidase subunit 2
LSKDLLWAGIVWIVLSAIGELLLIRWDFFPVRASEEAGVVDDAFLLLAVLGLPVFTFVVTAIGYSLFRFRSTSDAQGDGPPVRTSRRGVALWLAVTGALCLAVIVHPGYTGLRELRASAGDEPDVVVNVTAQQWVWVFEYQGRAVTTINELVLPVDSLVRFNITSRDEDVVHSFWVPAFRIKVDAVPGLVTHIDAHPNRIGSFDEDVNYRVQCAELCGLKHAIMFARVRVVDDAEFQKWVLERAR